MTVTDKISIKDLEEKLSDFKSSNQLYVHRLSESWKMMLSEGCFFVREAADGYWLFDMILSYQSSSALIGVTMQKWNIRKVRNGQLQIVCEDRNGIVLIARTMKKKLSLDDLTIYVTGNHARLKSEFLYG
jgi:hypothetical protein